MRMNSWINATKSCTSLVWELPGDLDFVFVNFHPDVWGRRKTPHFFFKDFGAAYRSIGVGSSTLDEICLTWHDSKKVGRLGFSDISNVKNCHVGSGRLLNGRIWGDFWVLRLVFLFFLGDFYLFLFQEVFFFSFWVHQLDLSWKLFLDSCCITMNNVFWQQVYVHPWKLTWLIGKPPFSIGNTSSDGGLSSQSC